MATNFYNFKKYYTDPNEKDRAEGRQGCDFESAWGRYDPRQ